MKSSQICKYFNLRNLKDLCWDHNNTAYFELISLKK